MRRLVLGCLAAVGCGSVGNSIDAAQDTALIDTPPVDMAIDAEFLGVFGTPESITGVSAVTTAETDISLTGDELELYFATDRAGTGGGRDICMTKRTAIGQLWGTPAEITSVNSTMSDASPQVSRDGLTLWFGSDRPGGQGGNDVYVSVRASRTAPWGAPVVVTELSSAALDRPGLATADGLRIGVYSDRAGATTGADLYESTRSAIGAAWSTPVVLAPLNSTGADSNPSLSTDGLTIYFATSRTGTLAYDLYTSTRASLTAAFAAPTAVTELNTTGEEGDPWISNDGHRIYFSRAAAASPDYDLFVASR